MYIRRIVLFLLLSYSAVFATDDKGDKLVDVIGQHFILTLPQHATQDQLNGWLERCKPAGVMLLSSHCTDRKKTKKLITGLQKHAAKIGIPRLIIAVDWEGGIVARMNEEGGFVSVPSPYALARSGRSACFIAGMLIGQQLRDLGVTCDFAPSVDLFNKDYPTLGTRCFSDDPVVVADCAVAFSDGLMVQGIIPVIKHFPGLGLGVGDTHLQGVTVTFDDATFKKHTQPFIDALKAGVPCVMGGHMRCAQCDNLPATLSAQAVALLKKAAPETLFITDDFSMKAVHGELSPAQAMLKSLSAGYHLIIYSGTPCTQEALVSGSSGDQGVVLDAIAREIGASSVYKKVHQERLREWAALREKLFGDVGRPHPSIHAQSAHSGRAVEVSKHHYERRGESSASSTVRGEPFDPSSKLRAGFFSRRAFSSEPCRRIRMSGRKNVTNINKTARGEPIDGLRTGSVEPYERAKRASARPECFAQQNVSKHKPPRLDERAVAQDLARSTVKIVSRRDRLFSATPQGDVQLITVDLPKIRPSEPWFIDLDDTSYLSRSLTFMSGRTVNEHVLNPRDKASLAQLEEIIEQCGPHDDIVVQTFFFGSGEWNERQMRWLEIIKKYCDQKRVTILSLGHPSEQALLANATYVQLGSFHNPMIDATLYRLENKPTITGAQRLVWHPEKYLTGKRFGLLCHKASMVSAHGQQKFLPDVLYAWARSQHDQTRLAALFSPEHGLLGTHHDGAVVASDTASKWGCPVYSLHGVNRRPSAEMLRDLDLLVIDLQDVGVRCYTYLSSLQQVLEMAQSLQLPVIVLDRANPLFFWDASGPMLEPSCESFLGKVFTQFVYGTSIGQLAKDLWRSHPSTGSGRAVILTEGKKNKFRCEDLSAPAHPELVEGHGRGQKTAELTVLDYVGGADAHDCFFAEQFVAPSPNLASIEAVHVYPLTVFIEGTNYSEGRGTRYPFQQIGAPWVHKHELARALNRKKCSGVYFEPISFTPATIQGKADKPKHERKLCHGVFVHILDRAAVDPTHVARTILATLFQLYPEQSVWLPSGKRFMVDLLAGTPDWRTAITEE